MNTGVNRKYCSGGKMKYGKGGFWDAIGDYGKFLADVPLSVVGAKDVIGKDDYNTQLFKFANDVTGTVMPIAGQVAANVIAPGIGGAMMGGIQSVGSTLNPMEEQQPNRPDMLKATNIALTPSVANTPTYVLKKGGNLVNNNQMINTFNGPSHENGGIAIGQNNEVEGGETSLKDYIFSDTTKVPGTKITFAQMSKRIEKKYGLRQNDAIANKAKERELQALKEIQEEVRFKEDADTMAKLADNNPQLFQQMTGQSANPAVQELMPGQQQQMVNVPMQQLKKGGKLLKNKSTILGTSRPGVTMEAIRSGRHYIDTLVAVTHNRRRRYDGGGKLKNEEDKSSVSYTEAVAADSAIAPKYMTPRTAAVRTLQGGIFQTERMNPTTGEYVKVLVDKTGNILSGVTSETDGKYPMLATPLTPSASYRKGGSIHINPEKKGTFTAAATKHGEGVQEFASQVLANKEDYSPAMVKKANFARNTSKWKHDGGGGIVGENPIDWRKYYYATPNDVKAFDYNEMQQYEYWNRVRQSDIAEGRYREPSSYIERAQPQQNQQTYRTLPSGVPLIDPYMGQQVNKHKFTARFTEPARIEGQPLPMPDVETINPVASSYQPVTGDTPPWITDTLYNPNKQSNAVVQPSTSRQIYPNASTYEMEEELLKPMAKIQPKVVNQIPTTNVFPEQVATRDIPTIDGITPEKTGNESSITPGAMVGMGIQGAGLLAKGILLGKRNKYMPAEYTPVAPVSFERVNAREPLAQSKSAFAGANTMLSRNAGSTGQYLSNRIASGVGEGMQRAGIVEQVNNQNAQIQAQEATQNAQIALQNAQRKLQVGEINQQEYDSITDAWNGYMNDIIGVGAGVTKDVLGYNAQDIALANLTSKDFTSMWDGKKFVTVLTPEAQERLRGTWGTNTTQSVSNNNNGSATVNTTTTTTSQRKGGYLKNKNKQYIIY
jgi:hypothetical protein